MRVLTESERQTLVNALNVAKQEYIKCADVQRGLAKIPEMRTSALHLRAQFVRQIGEVVNLMNLIEEAETIQIEEPEKEEEEEPNYFDEEPRDYPKDQMDYAWNEPGAPFTYGDY